MTAFSIISSTSHAVSGTAYTFQPDLGVADPNPLNDPKPSLVRVWSDVGINIRVGGGPATFDDLAVASGLDGILLSVPPGAPVSVIAQAGGPAGTAWFARVKSA